MLFVTDKIIKLGGTTLPGIVTSVEIAEDASIYVAQDDKGKIKKMQSIGFESGKITIEIILEGTKSHSSLDQLKSIQVLFRCFGQSKPRLMRIVNDDCAARGISKVYFKNLTTKKVIAESKRVVSVELLAPKVAGIKVRKSSQVSHTKSKSSSGTQSKSKKTRKKSPAVDTRSTNGAKKAAKRVTKGR